MLAVRPFFENNGTANHKMKANAWYLEPGYQLSQVMWTRLMPLTH